MSTVLVNHYIYKGTEYTNLDKLITVLASDGINITKGQIPDNVGWQRAFWSNHNVEWYQSEREQDIQKLSMIQVKALQAINKCYNDIKNKGVVCGLGEPINYEMLHELMMIIRSIDYTPVMFVDQTANNDSVEYYAISTTKLTRSQIVDIVNEINKQYAVIIERRNIAIHDVKNATTITEAQTAANKFIEYCELLIE